MYALLVPIMGALLTIQNSLNSVLALHVGNLQSLILIHLSGFIPLSIIILFRKEKALGGKLPYYAYLGGSIGVGTVIACNIAYAHLGASLAVALALLGQTVASILVDATGLMGRKRYPLHYRSLPGILLALAGVAIMAGQWEGQLPYLLLALLGGALPALSFTMNSQLAVAKGQFRSAWWNYAVGLATTVLVLLLLRPGISNSLAALPGLSPIYIVGGGLFGVVMVAGMNVLYPKLPSLWSTLLIFVGQALTGVLVDALNLNGFSARKLIGTLVVLLGMAVNAMLAARNPHSVSRP